MRTGGLHQDAVEAVRVAVGAGARLLGERVRLWPAGMADWTLSRPVFLLWLLDGVLVFWILVLFWYRWRVLAAPTKDYDSEDFQLMDNE